MLESLELFAGAGGLAMGIAKAGFRNRAVLEWERGACGTIRANQARGVRLVADWQVHERDVREFEFGDFQDKIDLLAGGPPCQPFSMGGRHLGPLDPRDMFPAFFRAVREVRPKAFLVENVRGLTRKNFAAYLEYIYLHLSHPELTPEPSEGWLDHLKRLEQHHTSSPHGELAYNVIYRVLNAADYGVPQRRDRLFMVGFRTDLGIEWSFPEATHFEEELLRQQWLTGEYWDRHSVPKKNRPAPPARALRLRDQPAPALHAPGVLPWRTVRDAIGDLPDPRTSNASHIPNHVYVAGARSYPGHTGSHPDLPAKTLKAGVHGVPGGENTLQTTEGHVRYFTVREAARIQTFPDDYTFPGAWTQAMRQLGNAVPTLLASTLATAIGGRLLDR